MVEVIDGNIEKAILFLRRGMAKSGVLEDLKHRSYFLSRSERRKMKNRKAARRRRKNLARVKCFDPNRKVWVPWEKEEKTSLRDDILKKSKEV